MVNTTKRLSGEMRFEAGSASQIITAELLCFCLRQLELGVSLHQVVVNPQSEPLDTQHQLLEVGGDWDWPAFSLLRQAYNLEALRENFSNYIGPRDIRIAGRKNYSEGL